jgi:hypothetical protein
MKTTLLFTRDECLTVTTFAVVTFISEQTQDPAILMEKFKSAVTQWINTTTAGHDAWTSNEGDFNIGDYANHAADTDLNRLLLAEGIVIEISAIHDTECAYAFDMPLADEDEIYIE